MGLQDLPLMNEKAQHLISKNIYYNSTIPSIADPIFVIIEYIAGGTLQDFLRKSRSEHNYKNLHGESQTLSARDLTSYAYQVKKMSADHILQ